MANPKNLFTKASLTLVDGLLLALSAAALTYLSVPFIAKLGTALGEAAEPNKHADIQTVGVLVFVPSAVHGQSRQSSHVPDQFEFFEGHAYMGDDWVKWERDRLVFTKRVADMSGKDSFVETVEKLNPTPEAWQRFWARIDSLGVWRWKLDYHDPKRNWPDGESWALTLRFGERQVKSKGYNAVPDAYSEFRDAVYKLMEDARRHERE